MDATKVIIGRVRHHAEIVDRRSGDLAARLVDVHMILYAATMREAKYSEAEARRRVRLKLRDYFQRTNDPIWKPAGHAGYIRLHLTIMDGQVLGSELTCNGAEFHALVTSAWGVETSEIDETVFQLKGIDPHSDLHPIVIPTLRVVSLYESSPPDITNQLY